VYIVYMKVTLRVLAACVVVHCYVWCRTLRRIFDAPFDSEDRLAAQQLRIKIHRLLRQHTASQRNLCHLFDEHRLQQTRHLRRDPPPQSSSPSRVRTK
jgi:hypothetical protein